MSFMSENGERLVDNGYPIIPITPSSKVPGVFQAGQWVGYAGWNQHWMRPNNPEEVARWSRYPGEVGIGIACGRIIAVDIDIVHDTALAMEIDGVARQLLGNTPATRIGLAPKRLLVYRATAPFAGVKKKPIEIIGRGQQFVAHGLHPETGQPYYWIDESLLDLDISRLPEVSEEQVRAFLAVAYEHIPVDFRPATLGGDDRGVHRAHDYLQGTYDAVEHALARIPNPDLPYEDWMRIGMALKGGLGDAGQVLFFRWSALSQKDVVATTARGWAGYKPTSIGAGTVYHIAGTYHGWKCPSHMTMNGAVAWEQGHHPAQALLDAAAAIVGPPEDLNHLFVPEAFSQLNGVMAGMVDYILTTAHRKQPILAVAASIAAIGVLAGRRYMSPSGLRTNVYAIGMAESGGGKDHARKCLLELFIAAGLSNLIGGSRLVSGAGLVATLAREPATMFQMDEFGKFLRLVIDRRAPKHVAEIWDFLTELATTAGSTWLGAEYADQRERPRTDIVQPCCCIHATTVPAAFWQALQSSSLVDGSLARWLMFPTDDPIPPQQRRPRVLSDTPSELIAGIHAVNAGAVAWNPGNLALAGGSQANPNPHTVPYDSAAEAHLYELSEAISEAQRAELGTLRSALLARVWEQIVRLALIYAISRQPASPVIDLTAVLWADQIVGYCTSVMLRDAERFVSDNESEALVKRVVEVIRSAGASGLARNELTRRTRFLGNDRRREEILEELRSAGQLLESVNKTQGRNATRLKLAF